MTKKNIFRSLFVALAAVSFGACTFQQDDLFDESASLRIENFNEQLKDKLVKQSTNGNNGWVMQYFTVGTDEEDFEGVNIVASFEASGKVTLASNHRFMRGSNAGNYTESTSTYDMLKEEGPVLSFNTWNDVLTVMVDPVNPLTGARDGEGMNGDQNLAFKAYDGNSIVFRGERHGAEVRFVPCETSAAAYLTIVEVRKSISTSSTLNSYYVTNGDADTLYLTGLNTGLPSYQDRLVEPLEVKPRSCVFTPYGFRMNRVDSLGGKGFQEFTMSDDKTYLVANNGITKLIPCWDWYIWDCSSTWKLDESSFTTEQAALFDQMKTEVKKVNANFELDSIAIGRTTETVTEGAYTYQMRYPGLVCCVHGPKKMGRVPQYRPYIDMNIDKPEYGVLKFSHSALDRTTDNMQIFAETNLQNLCKQFAATIYGTYKMEPDKTFRPTQATLTPTGSGNPILLMLKPIKD